MIDVVIVKKPPLPLLLWTAQLLFFHKFDKSIYVETYQAKHVVVKNMDKMSINLDGEYVELNGDLDFSIVPKSLKVIIP